MITTIYSENNGDTTDGGDNTNGDNTNGDTTNGDTANGDTTNGDTTQLASGSKQTTSSVSQQRYMYMYYACTIITAK